MLTSRSTVAHRFIACESQTSDITVPVQTGSAGLRTCQRRLSGSWSGNTAVEVRKYATELHF